MGGRGAHWLMSKTLHAYYILRASLEEEGTTRLVTSMAEGHGLAAAEEVSKWQRA